MPNHNSHIDIGVYLSAFCVGLWGHALADPWGTIAVGIAILGGLVRLALNVREWVRGRGR
jgi:hypothetical protein